MIETITVAEGLAFSCEFDKFSKAFVEAQKEMENPTKDSNNPFFNSKYADLANVLGKIKDALNKNGLWFTQHPSLRDNLVAVRTMIVHESGQWMSSTCYAPLTKKMVKGVEKDADAQSIGSCITYLRRYSLAAICGIAQEDDDGNGASNNEQENRRLAHANTFKPVYGKSNTPTFESLDGVAFTHEDGKKKTIDEVFEGDNIPDWAPIQVPKEKPALKVFSDEFMKAEKSEIVIPKEIAEAIKFPTAANIKIKEFSTTEIESLLKFIEQAELKSKNSKNKIILNFIHEALSEELGERNK